VYLSQTAEYALRAMAHLASLPRGEALRAVDLSEVTGIPTPYLSKILRRLVVAGLLTSQKGHHGGFSLAKPPSRLRFEQILVATDYEPDPERCAFGWGECDPKHPCPLHPAWSELNEAYGEWARRTTLADVANDAGANPRKAGSSVGRGAPRRSKG